jgi:hypothetical protein
MLISDIVATATPMSGTSWPRLEPLSVPRMGAKSVFGAPAVGLIGNDVRVRDGGQAAPPRGELC